MGFPKPGYLGNQDWEVQGLKQINILLGRNGCGKSVFLRSLRDKFSPATHYIIPERSGDITFDAGYAADGATASGRQNRSNANYTPNYRQTVIARIQSYYTTRGSRNVEEISQNPEDLLRYVEIILPEFTLRVKPESPYYDLRRIKDDAVVISSVNSLSSGESQLLTLGLDIMSIIGIWEIEKNPYRLLLIDEPDAHIHPDLQIKFSDFLVQVTKAFKLQLIVATHSTTLLSSIGQFGGDSVSLIYLKPELSKLTAQPYNSVTREIACFLGGHLTMGTLFASPIMLVEGDDDYRIWVQVARSGNVDICVLPCNGEEIKKYRNTLENMFAALSEEKKFKGIALIDNDKGKPTPSPTSKQDFVPFIQLNCLESENLYLTDEILNELGYTWKEARNKIYSERKKFTNKFKTLAKIRSIDRQTADIKIIINEIAEILDPKNVLWTVRLGKYMGKNKPTGMLAKFLGDDVINALWPTT
jgi:predicted ATPase